MNQKKSIYTKWQFKFIKVAPYKDEGVVAKIKAKEGFGDKENEEIWSESALQNEIIKRREKDDVTYEGAKELLKAFDEIRNYKKRMNIPLNVKNPDTDWILPKRMTTLQRLIGKFGEVISGLLFMGIGLLFIYLIVTIFRTCG